MNLEEHNEAFFAIDIVDSTLFKYSVHVNQWKDAFHYFFNQAEDEIQKTFSSVSLEFKPVYWKAIGDCIVFKAKFKTPEEFLILAQNFMIFFTTFANEIKQKYEIQVKFNIWHATFPNINLKFNTGGKEDFIGPDMDVGFRLASKAIPNKCLITMDSVLLIASIHDASLSFIHLGWAKLKGVKSEQNYPIFQIIDDHSYWNHSLVEGFEGIKGDKAFGKLDYKSAIKIIEQYKEDLNFSPFRV